MISSRVAIVTGTSRGIGLYLAQQLVANGWSVVGCGRSHEGPITSERFAYVQADVSDPTAALGVCDVAWRLHGRVDALVNNAGVAAMNHAMTTPAEDVDRILRVNVFGTFLFAREAAKLMIRRQHGRIVNLSSVAVPLRLPGESIYVVSKAAVEELTRVLAQELGPFGITVNVVGPGPVDTDLIRGVPEAKIDDVVSMQAIRRRCTLEDVWNAVEFFLCEESSMVTGQVLYLGVAS